MKNLLENVAVLFVLLLSLTIIALIVKYNMIEDDTLEANYPISVVKEVPKKESTNDYLNKMEHYDDVDVKVDPTQQDSTNKVVVKSEQKENSIEDAVKDDYVEKLEQYTDENPKDAVEAQSPVVQDEPERLEKDETDDEVGKAIDAVLNE